MAKTYNQIKKSVLGKNYDINKNSRKTEKRGKTYDDIKKGVKNGEYNFSYVKKDLEKQIRFETFASDLSSMGKTIGDIHTNWQTQETMQNTRNSVESMKNRLKAYKEYNQLFGGGASSKDISQAISEYSSVLDNWDSLSKVYGNYKNADAYKKETETLKTLYGMSSSDIKNKMDEGKKQASDIENKLKIAKEYDGKIQKLQNEQSYVASRSYGLSSGIYKDQISSLEKEKEDYLKSIGYSSVDEIEKALKVKKNNLAYTTASGQNIMWQDLYDDAYLKEYTQKITQSPDFESTSAYEKKDVKYESASKFAPQYKTVDDEFAHVYNLINGDKDALEYEELYDVHMWGTNDDVKYKHFTDDERKVFNSLAKTQGKEKALEYANLLSSDLRQRRVEEQNAFYAQIAQESPIGSSVASVLANVGNNAMALPFLAMDYAEDGSIDENSSLYNGRRMVNTTRSTVEGMIDNDVGQFFYRHGMNVADNLASRAVSLGMGSGFASQFLMSSGAVVDTVLDSKERGLSDEQALGLGAVAGVAEWYFESKGFEALVDTKTLTRSAWKYFVNDLKTELVGELSTEFSNDVADYFIAQDLNKLKTEYTSYINSGLSEKDALKKVVGGVLSRYADVAAGTIFSTGVMAGPGSIIGGTKQHSFNKQMGQTIKANERVGDVFDIASNPEVATAYEAYTRYANKGINAENISDAQLGNLYSSAKADAVETFKSKKSTSEQKQGAMQTLARLGTVETENTVKKEAQKDFNIGEETKVTKSGASVDVKDLKVKVNGDEVTVDTNNNEISVDDMTFAQNDAELVVLAKGIAKSDGEDFANLFLSQYDGKTNVEEYANSFNLTMAYAKNDFTYKTILENKGSLSTDQVNEIYAKARVEVDKARQDAIDQLNKDMADKMTYKGYINDSVIDYDNTSAEGKVNWNDLDSRQRQAVTFIKGFAQAAGMNLVLTHNPKSKTGGSYNVTGNTITIDIAKYEHIEKGLMETIIPTMSHETTHWMEEKSPELWNKINELVFSTLQEADGISEVDRIASEIKRLEGKGRKATAKEARSEIIARACEDMLSMSEQGKKMFNSLSESEKKNFTDKIKELIQNLKDWVGKLLGTYKSSSYEAKVLRQYEERLNEISKVWDEMLVKSVEANQALEKSGAFEHDVTSIGTRDLSELSDAVGTDGESLFQYRAMVEDENIYRAMLLQHKKIIGISDEQIAELFDTIDKAVDIISNNLEALDYAWDVDVDDRAFSPVKPNSDSLYKVSLDFSTLCRKRLLQQTIQQTLQNALDKNLSKEESIAIRDELIKIQDEGRKIEVACALCYVESARMKSPTQINKFLNNREAVIKEFFANRSGGSIKEKVAKAEEKARKELQKANPNGFFGKNNVKLDPLTAPKSKMVKADADYIRAEGKKAKASYKLTEQEQRELDVAIGMSIDNFTSAKGLEDLAKHHKDIFDAYTSFVRNATHSKGIENDTWWRAGDSNAIGDNLIAQMNAENGLRSQFWSDFQVIHLLDYIAATIELSTKGAKRQSYTKVPDYVKLLGNTGDMINMSLIPERVFDGKLSYDGVEGMAYDIAKQLRDEYHETVGTICIGINNEQIRLLLEDSTIDMIIPYHHSSMSKAVRKLMHIPEWESYQNYQNEKNLSDAEAKANAQKYGVKLKHDSNYQVAPKFSEWFNLDEARQIAKLENNNPSNMEAYKKYGKMYGGYMAMQNAANNYLKLCAERGIAPKFSSKDSDFTQDANYWKLLIDRKMVDNVTGEIIEQKPIKPIFNEKSILEILNDELARYPQVKADQEYATRKVTEKFLSGEMKVDKSTLDAIQKPIDNVTNVNILESAREGMLKNKRTSLVEEDLEEYLQAGTRKNISKQKALQEGKKIILTTKDEITAFIHSSIENDSSLNTVGYGRVDERLSRDVDEYSGGDIKIDGNFLELVPSDIYHAYKEHLKAKELGDIDLSMEDFENIPSYLEHYDELLYAIQFKGGNTKICVSKKLPNGRVLIVEVVSKSRGSIAFKNMIGVSEEKYVNEFQSMYKKRNTPNARGSKSSNNSLRDENVSTDIIYDTNKNVNTLFAKKDSEELLYSDRVTDKETLDFLNNQKTLKVYRAMQLIDGKLYPPMAAKVRSEDGRKQLVYSSEIDVWEQATEHPELIKNGKFELDKANGSSIYAAYNPYIHTSASPLNDQFSSAYKRDNLVTVEGEIPVSELTSGYRAEFAKDSVGETKWHSGPVASKLKGDKARRVFLSRWFKPTRIVPDSEVASIVAKILEGENISVPYKVVTPTLRTELEKEGVLIRYSDRDSTSVYDVMGERDRLLKENEKFKAEIERLKERLKLERQITNGNYFNENQLGAVAGHLRNIARSTYSKEVLVDGLKDVYSFIAHSPQLTWEEVFAKCYNIADAMIAESTPEVTIDDYSKEILRDIKKRRISLSESQKQEAANIFGKNWNRYFFGKVIVTDKGIPLEGQWQEWAELFPGTFNTDISDGNMVGELYDIINTLKETSETVDEYSAEEQKRWLANEIYNQYWNVSTIKTTADKYDKQIKKLNFEHRKAMAEYRTNYENRMAEQGLADDMYYGRKIAEQKDKYNKNLAEYKQKQKERHQRLYNELRERKDREVALAKQHGRDMMDKYKENAERKTRIQSITSNALSLNEMLVKNSKDKHVPEILKDPVVALLKAINFSSNRLLDKGEPTKNDISLSKALSKVKDMMVKATNAHEELVELYGHGLDEDIEKMVDSVDNIMRTVGDNEFILNKMTSADLQTLDKMVTTIRHAVNKLNKFHIVNHARGIANLSHESVEYLDSLGKGKIYDGKKGAIKKLLDWGNALPYYVFKRFGSGGMKVYEALQDGWDKFAFNVKEVIDYANNTYTDKEVKEWSKDIKTFKILIPANEIEKANKDYVPQYQEVQMTVPQIMSMYCLNKREQARGHLFQGGIRVADFKDKKGKIVSQADGIVFTEKDIQTIFDSLTDRQKAVADKLQEFMNTVCADWGNEVSMARFGYKAFGEENYFPIQSDKNNLAVNDETEQPNSLFKLLNMSFTKSTIEKANNRIVISDIFDVFAQHTSDMAKYNSLALSVLDSFKWYNYTEKQDIAEGTFKTMGVKQSIEKAFGKDGQSYFTTFLKDINGQQEVSRDTLGNGFFKNAKIASVGANLRVVLLQPTSYVRASAVIDNKYLMKALGHKPKIKRAEDHCGIALWKSLGYYDTNIQRGLEAQIKHADTWKDKTTEWAMKGAEVADKITWGYLWNACELEIRDTRKDLRVGSEEFYNAVGKRLREVIYATQVVDSTMTRSQMMRSSDGKDKMLTAFASEPTLSYNMLQDAYMEYTLDARSMGKKEAINKNGKKIARVVVAYTMTNALAALVESGFDAWREDDEEEEMDVVAFMKFYLSNFANDMSIGNKIPYVKELYSFIQGFGSSRTDTQWMEEMTKAITTWYKLFNGKGKGTTAIRYSIKAISDLSGLPFYNVYRDLMATLNKFDLFTAEDLNEMFEDFFN